MTVPDPWTSATLATMGEALGRMVTDQRTPGGVIAVGTTDTEPEFAGIGVTALGGEVTPTENTLYDLASLTKVVATWPLVGRALSSGLLDLDTPVAKYFPAHWQGPGGTVTVRQILTHTSGMMPATRLDRYVGDPRDVAELILAEPLEEPGVHRYINRGFILLGLLLARVHGIPLRQLLDQFGRDLGLADFQFGPLLADHRVAPTERRLVGGDPLHGVVHDENAHTLGGVAGHAGVFASARALASLARELLSARSADSALRLKGYVAESWTPRVGVGESTHRGLGWLLTASGLAYHHGFTGTSLYLHPDTGRYLVLLTNAIAHGRERTGLSDLRTLAAKQFS